MKAPLRLATENGHRVRRTPKAKRLAAQPATDAARLMRAVSVIRAEAEKVEARHAEARKVVAAVFRASCGDDPLVTRALAREAMIECSYSQGMARVARYCAMAEEGTLCA